MDILFEMLQSETGSFGFVFGLVMAAFFLVHYVTKHITRWSVKLETSEKDVVSLNTNVDTIKQDIMYIKSMLTQQQANSPGGLTQSNSPVSLTPKGFDIAKKMNIDELIALNWEKIFTFLNDTVKSDNAYDIQQYCIEIATISLDKFFRDEDEKHIKLFAFQEGQNLAYYGVMIGVLVRDRYFKEKNINIEEVDKSDPAKN